MKFAPLHTNSRTSAAALLLTYGLFASAPNAALGAAPTPHEELSGDLGSSYCVAAPNSVSNSGAQIIASGSSNISVHG